MQGMGRFLHCLSSSSDKYIKRGHGFDAAVSLEQILAFIAEGDSNRSKFKSQVIQSAINKAELTGPQVIDDKITAFREGYFNFLQAFFESRPGELRMREPRPAWKGEIWFHISSPLLPNGAYIHHKADRGFVDLMFPNTDAERLRSLQPTVSPSMEIHQTGKSAAIRILVPSISDWNNFSNEQEKVAKALSAASELLDLYRRERSQIDRALTSAMMVV
jgi:hypothetical protein